MTQKKLLSFIFSLLLLYPVLVAAEPDKLNENDEVCDHFQIRIIAPDDSFRICPSGAGMLTFSAEAGYGDDAGIAFDPLQFTYHWSFSGVQYDGMEVSHYFEGPGAYPVTLTVTDPVNDCMLQITKVLQIATTPTFSGTMISVDTACAGDAFTLFGVGNPTVWTGFPTGVEETVFIPDGDETYYESSLEFDVFGQGVEILSAQDIDRICVNLEHTDQSQLRFELESPTGEILLLKATGGPTANLGEPVVWDDNIPGRGYAYCFTPSPQYGLMAVTTPQFHEYTDRAGNYYFNAAYMPSGSYTPQENLDKLAGSPLNGKWTMRVTDTTPSETGHVFGWSLFFDEGFYPDSLIFYPEIVDSRWFFNGTPIDGNPASSAVQQSGDHQFRFQITDNFGCTYDTLLTVTILPLPETEIISDLEIPVCEGDSTFLQVIPVNSSGFDWVYQWQTGNQDIPGRTYDTLMVKTPATYTVMITDTVSGCIGFADFDFTEQNCDLTIPNVFTPNGDGINDLFEILNLEHYPNAQMIIYNRWGQKVFEHPDYYNNWWDGGNAPDGVYFYVLRYARMGQIRYAEGTVTIIR